MAIPAGFMALAPLIPILEKAIPEIQKITETTLAHIKEQKEKPQTQTSELVQAIDILIRYAPEDAEKYFENIKIMVAAGIALNAQFKSSFAALASPEIRGG